MARTSTKAQTSARKAVPASPALVMPNLHPNGVDGRTLRWDIGQTLIALKRAQGFMATLAPKGPNYHPQGPDTLTLARRQHEDRLARVQAIIDELEAFETHVDTQIALKIGETV